jgi:hypothetical protein
MKRKKKATRKNSGPDVSIREYKFRSGPKNKRYSFELWVEKESVFCGHDMKADDLTKFLRKLGIRVRNKNLDDRSGYEIRD